VLQEQRILKELGQLGHPNVIGLEGSFHDDRFFYLVNEFCDGGDLQAYIEREGAMDEDIARFYAAEMVLGIQHLHRHSIIHRDLKLANVLMMASGHIVIADMGLVRCFNGERVAGGSALRSVEEHFTNSCCGTLTHMAPEVLAAEIYSYEVDWWALGIMVYNMLFTEVSNIVVRSSEQTLTPMLVANRSHS
jgi:serine/threonine protein kinase